MTEQVGLSAELGGPDLDQLPLGFTTAADGSVVRRPGTDSLRLEVVPTPNTEGYGFQLQVHVNDIEMTSAGAGLGMEPYPIFFPVNLLAASSEPRTVPIARCRCTFYDCMSTDVTISRDRDIVHWDWSHDVPMDRGVSFAAAHYDSEITRAAADLSWEPEIRIAERLVRTNLDREYLRDSDQATRPMVCHMVRH